MECRAGKDKEGRVMRVRDDRLLIGCRSAHRLEFVLARTWEVLPERKWRRLSKRRGWSGADERCIVPEPLEA